MNEMERVIKAYWDLKKSFKDSLNSVRNDDNLNDWEKQLEEDQLASILTNSSEREKFIELANRTKEDSSFEKSFRECFNKYFLQ